VEVVAVEASEDRFEREQWDGTQEKLRLLCQQTLPERFFLGHYWKKVDKFARGAGLFLGRFQLSYL